MKPAPLRPSSPERICWGCDRYCPAHDLGCGGGTIRTPHPIEMFGEEWATEQESAEAANTAAEDVSPAE